VLEACVPTRASIPRLGWSWRHCPGRIAYTALLSPDRSKPDALAVVDVEAGLAIYGQVIQLVVWYFR
jgi:methanethiol oxidase